MPVPSSYPFTRYLSAKKSVDDRALNKNVWKSLAATLNRETVGRPIRILEIGAGIGTMLERALEWGLLTSAEYTAIDSMQENVEEALRRIPRWARGNGYDVSDRDAGSLRLESDEGNIRAIIKPMDVLNFM